MHEHSFNKAKPKDIANAFINIVPNCYFILKRQKNKKKTVT